MLYHYKPIILAFHKSPFCLFISFFLLFFFFFFLQIILFYFCYFIFKRSLSSSLYIQCMCVCVVSHSRITVLYTRVSSPHINMRGTMQENMRDVCVWVLCGLAGPLLSAYGPSLFFLLILLDRVEKTQNTSTYILNRIKRNDWWWRGRKKYMYIYYYLKAV